MPLFKSFGEQLLAVRSAALAPHNPDPLLSQLQQRSLGSNETVPGDGGFLVQPQFVTSLVERMYQTGEILSRCQEVLLSQSNQTTYPQFDESSRANGSRLGGVQAYWVPEATPATGSKPKFARSTLTCNKLVGLIYVTDELMRDAAALEQFTSGAFAQEMAFNLESKIVSGSGEGQPLGILNSSALIQIPKETGQASATVLAQNVVKAVSRLWAPSRKTAVWIVNQELLPQLFTLTVAVGTGGSDLDLFDFCGGEADSPWDRLAGIPVIPVEHCPAAGNVGDLLLCDFSRYLIASREAQSALSIHVRFESDESAFRFTMRVDGQPIDRGAVTPLNGSLTTSPFVAIGAR